MWTVAILLVHLLLQSTTAWLDTATCSKLPVDCDGLDDLKVEDECLEDIDCGNAGACCYQGCKRKCFNIQPCGSVACKNGTVCEEQELPCDKAPCAQQANCITLEQYRCRASTPCPLCPAGFEPVKDQYGCDVTPCRCVPAKANPDCGISCKKFCAHGYETTDNGCQTCACKPEPENPCTNRDCGPDAECRLVQTRCSDRKCVCEPRDICVPKAQVVTKYDDRCALMDPTTVGRPVLRRDVTGPLNCSDGEPCPHHSVCVGTGQGLYSCCWQHTQSRLYSDSPKIGSCPDPLALNQTAYGAPCEVDAQCPGKRKCCFHRKSQPAMRHQGRCVMPLNHLVELGKLCENPPFGKPLMKLLNLCP